MENGLYLTHIIFDQNKPTQNLWMNILLLSENRFDELAITAEIHELPSIIPPSHSWQDFEAYQ